MKFHAMVAVPQQGLFAFGGIGNSITTAQKLTSLTGTWTSGPAVYLNQVDEGKCIVQVNNFHISVQHRSELCLQLYFILSLIKAVSCQKS